MSKIRNCSLLSESWHILMNIFMEWHCYSTILLNNKWNCPRGRAATGANQGVNGKRVGDSEDGTGILAWKDAMLLTPIRIGLFRANNGRGCSIMRCLAVVCVGHQTFSSKFPFMVVKKTKWFIGHKTLLDVLSQSMLVGRNNKKKILYIYKHAHPHRYISE